MFININGPPLEMWNLNDYIKKSGLSTIGMQMIQDPGYLLNIDMLQIVTWICKTIFSCVPPLFCYHLSTGKKPAPISMIAPRIVNFRAADSGVITLADQMDGTLKPLLQT